MKYKVHIKSNPEFNDEVKARSKAEAKRIVTRNALLVGINVLHTDEIEVIEVE